MTERNVSGPVGERLFAEFATTQRYRDLQAKMSEMLKNTFSKGEIPSKDLLRHFSGAMFEEIAYYKLAEETAHSALLAPEETFKYFQQYLYPDAPIFSDFLATSLKGISVPDGLLVTIDGETSLPKAVYEYTLTKLGEHQRPYFAPKYNAHHRHRQDYPRLFGNASLVFVVPSETGLADSIKASIGRSGVDVVELPFTHSAFGGFSLRTAMKLVQNVGFPNNIGEKIKAQI